MTLSITRLQKLLDYDPDTGVFTWRVDRRGRFARAGTVAGTLTKKRGRVLRQICIDCVIYMAGPLAVFWMTGGWPDDEVNYANGNGDDLRWSNLREANHSQAGATARQQANKKSKLPKGVSWDRHGLRFVAQIKVNYRRLHLGSFDTEAAAHEAYLAAASKHFGAFARG